MIKRAVRVLNASCVLSKKAAVRARAMALSFSRSKKVPEALRILRLPTITPSRSVTTMNCFRLACDAAAPRVASDIGAAWASLGLVSGLRKGWAPALGLRRFFKVWIDGRAGEGGAAMVLP